MEELDQYYLEQLTEHFKCLFLDYALDKFPADIDQSLLLPDIAGIVNFTRIDDFFCMF